MSSEDIVFHKVIKTEFLIKREHENTMGIFMLGTTVLSINIISSHTHVNRHKYICRVLESVFLQTVHALWDCSGKTNTFVQVKQLQGGGLLSSAV